MQVPVKQSLRKLGCVSTFVKVKVLAILTSVKKLYKNRRSNRVFVLGLSDIVAWMLYTSPPEKVGTDVLKGG